MYSIISFVIENTRYFTLPEDCTTIFKNTNVASFQNIASNAAVAKALVRDCSIKRVNNFMEIPLGNVESFSWNEGYLTASGSIDFNGKPAKFSIEGFKYEVYEPEISKTPIESEDTSEIQQNPEPVPINRPVEDTQVAEPVAANQVRQVSCVQIGNAKCIIGLHRNPKISGITKPLFVPKTVRALLELGLTESDLHNLYNELSEMFKPEPEPEPEIVPNNLETSKNTDDYSIVSESEPIQIPENFDSNVADLFTREPCLASINQEVYTTSVDIPTAEYLAENPEELNDWQFNGKWFTMDFINLGVRVFYDGEVGEIFTVPVHLITEWNRLYG